MNEEQKLADKAKQRKEIEAVIQSRALAEKSVKEQKAVVDTAIGELREAEKAFSSVYAGSLTEVLDQLSNVVTEIATLEQLERSKTETKRTTDARVSFLASEGARLEAQGECLKKQADKDWLHEQKELGTRGALMEYKLDDIPTHVQLHRNLFFIHEHEENASSTYWVNYLNKAREQVTNAWPSRFLLSEKARADLTILKEYVDITGFWVWSKGEQRVIGLVYNATNSSWEQQYYYEFSDFATAKSIFDRLSLRTIASVNLGAIDIKKTLVNIA